MTTAFRFSCSPLLFAWTLTLPVWPLSATAAACLYRGTDDTARVSGGGVVTTPFPEARSSPDCRRLRVSSGTVDVVVLGTDRETIASRRVGVGGGALVSASMSDGVATSDESNALLRNILVTLAGDQRSRTGSSRGLEDDYPSAALPAGKLSEPRSDLVVVLGPEPDRNLGSFELQIDGRTVVRTTGPSRELVLPAAVLKQGAQVSWTLVYAGRRAGGVFEVTSPERLAALKASFGDNTAVNDAKVVNLRLASGLISAGYAWDARELIRATLGP